MVDPDDPAAFDTVPEDRGLKALFTEFPQETVEVFAPELLKRRGRPRQVIAVSQELPPINLKESSRYLDVALRCDFAEGEPAFILLVEHWSDAYKVCLDRTAFYYTGLRLRHEGAEILPVILITDERRAPIETRLEGWAIGQLVFTFQPQITRLTPDQIPHLRSLQSMVAAVLLARVWYYELRDAVKATQMAIQRMNAAGARPATVVRFLSLAATMGRLAPEQRPVLYEDLREDPAMIDVFEEIRTEGLTKGKAEGHIANLRHLVAKGRLTRDAARAEIQELIADGEIPAEVGQQALVEFA